MYSNHWGVHLSYTVPAIGLLSFVARPLLCRSDILKISLISAAALTYVIQRGGNIVFVTSDDHSSPFLAEACASVIAQTVLTLLWSVFCFRWSTPCLSFNYNKRSYQLIRWAPILALGVVVTAGYGSTGPDASSLSYLGALLRWSFPAVVFAWYGAGNLFVGRIKMSTVAIVVPTLYLYWADRMCRVDGDVAGPGAFALKHLPSEHARLFYLIVNTLVVLAANGYDKASGMAEAYTTEFPRQFAYSSGYVAQLFFAFMTSEYSMPPGVVEDIRKCFDVLNNESTTFATAVLLFQCGEFYRINRCTIILFSYELHPNGINQLHHKLRPDNTVEMNLNQKRPKK